MGNLAQIEAGLYLAEEQKESACSHALGKRKQKVELGQCLSIDEGAFSKAFALFAQAYRLQAFHQFLLLYLSLRGWILQRGCLLSFC